MENRTLIRNILILTMNEGGEIIKDGEVVIEGDRIISVGSQGSGSSGSPAMVIDGTGKALMPGFINAHGHAAMTLLRSYADDLPLMHWLEKKIWPVEARLQEEDIYWGTMLSIVEMLKTGTTTFTDMYFFMDAVARAVEESGIRASLARGLIGIEPKSLEALKDSERFIKNWHGMAQGRITTMLGPHAPYTCPPDFLKKVISLSEKCDVPIQIHLSETRDEVERCLKDYGKTPVKLMESIGLLERPVLAAHAVHVTEEEIDIMADKNVSVAHNPGSNLKLGSGIAPVPKMMEKGINVALGTDGAASNNNLDMLEETRLAALLHKGYHEDPTLIKAEEALSLATRNGGRALYLKDEIGVIKEGAKADLVMLNLHRPHLCPLHDVVAHVVYSAQPGDIEMVMVNGKPVVEKGEILTVDEERVMHESQTRALRLVEQKPRS